MKLFNPVPFLSLLLLLTSSLGYSEDKTPKTIEPKLVWQKTFKEVLRIVGFALSDKGDVVVSDIIGDNKPFATRIRFIDKQGKEKWVFDNSIKSIAFLSPNGKFVAVGSAHSPKEGGDIFLLNQQGKTIGESAHYFEELIPANDGKWVYGLHNSEEFLAGIKIHQLNKPSPKRGSDFIKIKLEQPMAGYQINLTDNFDSFVVPDGSSVKFFKKDGKLIWKKELHGMVTTTVISGNGETIAALLATGENNITVLDKKGDILWKKTVSDIGNLKLTHDGNNLLLVGRTRLLLYGIKAGNLIWERELTPGVQHMIYPRADMTKNGKLVVCATGYTKSKVVLLSGKDGAILWQNDYAKKDINLDLTANGRYLVLQSNGRDFSFYSIDYGEGE
ncbi:PQQ-binding-like beta-propeller repeat protein [Elusimicrobiota bacterium]